MNIIKAHVMTVMCESADTGSKPRFGKFSNDPTIPVSSMVRMAGQPENFTKAGFFYSCRQSALANSHHGRTQDSGRYRKTNCSVENSMQVSPQARVTVMSHSTLPDECIRPAHLGFVNLHCRRSDPRMDHPA